MSVLTAAVHPMPRYALRGMRWALFLTGFVALAIALPWICHQFGIAGMVFLPLHAAVFLAAMVMGIRGGLITALAAPAASFALSGMPPIAALPAITIECCAYAAVAGWLVRDRRWRILPALIAAMLVGRLVSLGAWSAGLGAAPNAAAQLRALFVIGLPGIALQLVLLPPLAARIGDWLHDHA